MSVKASDPVRYYMSELPHSIEPNQSLEDAYHVMGKWSVRHLPVLSGGRIVGLLSERDLTYLKTLPGIEEDTFRVKDAMVYDPILVLESECLSSVAQKMAEQHMGCVLVSDHKQELIGIFTYVDALRALAQIP